MHANAPTHAQTRTRGRKRTQARTLAHTRAKHAHIHGHRHRHRHRHRHGHMRTHTHAYRHTHTHTHTNTHIFSSKATIMHILTIIGQHTHEKTHSTYLFLVGANTNCNHSQRCSLGKQLLVKAREEQQPYLRRAIKLHLFPMSSSSASAFCTKCLLFLLMLY